MNDEDDDEPKSGQEISKQPHSELILPRAGSGVPNIMARMRSLADRRYYKARAEEVHAHTDMTNALSDNFRAKQNLQRAFLESDEWNEDVERARIREQYAAEDARIKLAEQERQLDRLDMMDAIEQREHELEMARKRREAERNPPKEKKKPKPEKPDFKKEAEDILRHGNIGENMKIAKELVAAVIAERGGEGNLTEEDLEHIEILYEVARRKDHSRG